MAALWQLDTGLAQPKCAASPASSSGFDDSPSSVSSRRSPGGMVQQPDGADAYQNGCGRHNECHRPSASTHRESDRRPSMRFVVSTGTAQGHASIGAKQLGQSAECASSTGTPTPQSGRLRKKAAAAEIFTHRGVWVRPASVAEAVGRKQNAHALHASEEDCGNFSIDDAAGADLGRAIRAFDFIDRINDEMLNQHLPAIDADLGNKLGLPHGIDRHGAPLASSPCVGGKERKRPFTVLQSVEQDVHGKGGEVDSIAGEEEGSFGGPEELDLGTAFTASFGSSHNSGQSRSSSDTSLPHVAAVPTPEDSDRILVSPASPSSWEYQSASQQADRSSRSRRSMPRCVQRPDARLSPISMSSVGVWEGSPPSTALSMQRPRTGSAGPPELSHHELVSRCETLETASLPAFGADLMRGGSAAASDALTREIERADTSGCNAGERLLASTFVRHSRPIHAAAACWTRASTCTPRSSVRSQRLRAVDSMPDAMQDLRDISRASSSLQPLPEVSAIKMALAKATPHHTRPTCSDPLDPASVCASVCAVYGVGAAQIRRPSQYRLLPTPPSAASRGGRSMGRGSRQHVAARARTCAARFDKSCGGSSIACGSHTTSMDTGRKSAWDCGGSLDFTAGTPDVGIYGQDGAAASRPGPAAGVVGAQHFERECATSSTKAPPPVNDVFPVDAVATTGAAARLDVGRCASAGKGGRPKTGSPAVGSMLPDTSGQPFVEHARSTENANCPFSHEPLDSASSVVLRCGHRFAVHCMHMARQAAATCAKANFGAKDALVCPLCGDMDDTCISGAQHKVITYSPSPGAYMMGIRKDWQMPLRGPATFGACVVE